MYSIRDFYNSELYEYKSYIHEWFTWIVDMCEIDRKRIGILLKHSSPYIIVMTTIKFGTLRFELVYRQVYMYENKFYYCAQTGISVVRDMPQAMYEHQSTIL